MAEDKIKNEYDAVCGKLNMDQSSMDAAWESYKSIKDYYTLEGDHLEWLGCALYVAGQTSSLETVEGEAVSGNSISLTQILRATRLNLIEFFKKMKKWMEMAKLPFSFQQKIEALERKFEVASIIYDKYRKVFRDLFQLPDEKQTPNTRQRGRKSSKNRPCTPYEVFRFGWTLYIHIKGQYPQINDDLVNSHHLLLCCIDMLYCTSLMNKRRDLLNPECLFLPADFTSLDYTPPQELPCILTELCSDYNGIAKECRVIKDYYWRDSIKKLFQNQVLHGQSKSTVIQPGVESAPFLLMLSPSNFFSNEKSLNREYEMNVLAEGDFDERVFLHPSANEEIGTPAAMAPPTSIQSSLAVHTPPQHVQYGTPFLGRELLGSRDHKLTPASEATHSVTQLHSLLQDCPPEPSESLKKICSSCMSNPLTEVAKIVRTLSDMFLEKSPMESDPSPSSFAKLRLQLSVSLYYKLLAAIAKDEEKKSQDLGALQNILEHDPLHKSLFALCVEIVLFSYNSQSRAFPWVLEAFQISAFNFYKLIEVVVKLFRGEFPRSIVKHLNRIEEMVLDHLAWKSDSPLFDAIDLAGSVPPYKDVALPTPVSGTKTGVSLQHPRLRTLVPKGLESPLSSLHDRLVSPGSNARRQLFSPGGTAHRSSPIPIAPKPPQGGGGGVTVTPIPQPLNTILSNIVQQITKSPMKNLPGGGSMMSPSKPDPATEAAPSKASAGTQTSPHRTHAPSTSLQSPQKQQQQPQISIANTAEVLSSNTVVSPSKTPTVGSLLSPGGIRPVIPTSPPIPSVTITPSASPAKTPARMSQAGSRQIPATPATPATPRPKKTGSLALFYRKVYQLASIRIKDLCERLGHDSDFVQKAWTCFEHCMVKSPDLLRDRHLDQLIMCSVYILAKCLRLESITFQEIMRQYRHQPQAKSHVYRSVLLNSGPRVKPQPDTSSETKMDTSDPANLPPAPSTKETPIDQLLYRDDIPVGSRGDIIQFYNKVFIGFIKDFVLRFSPNEPETSSPSLSPLPVIRKTAPSPRKISRHHQIYVSPHKPGTSLGVQLSPLAKKYIIQKSPASDLLEINKVLKSGPKRALDLSNSASSPECPAKRPHLQIRGPRKPHSSFMQALSSVASDRAKSASNTDQ